MKISKLKSILFSLMAFTMLTIFMTSCEKENIQPIEEEMVLDTQTLNLSELENVINSRAFNTTCFVELCYSGYLRRCADESGLNYWLGVLGNATPNKIINVVLGFITSQEAKNKWQNNYTSYLAARSLNSHHISKHIYITYRGLLNRQPDVSGGIYWTGIQRNEGLRSAVNAMASSAEFANRLNNIQAECNAYNANCP